MVTTMEGGVRRSWSLLWGWGKEVMVTAMEGGGHGHYYGGWGKEVMVTTMEGGVRRSWSLLLRVG